MTDAPLAATPLEVPPGLRVRARTDTAPAMVDDTEYPVFVLWECWQKRWGVAAMSKAFGMSPYLISEALEYASLVGDEEMARDKADSQDGIFEEAERRLAAATRPVARTVVRR